MGGDWVGVGDGVGGGAAAWACADRGRHGARSHLLTLSEVLLRQASEARETATLVAAAGAVSWQSFAAQRFRGRLAEDAAAAGRSAQVLEEAARALRRHAACVEGAPGWSQAVAVARLVLP